MSRVVYHVDSLNGSDSDAGDILNPLQTLTEAYTRSINGGLIILQTGDGASYGDLTITKNVSIQAAYGASPVVGALTLSTSQGLYQGLTFDQALSAGFIIASSGYGSTSIRQCYFDSIPNPILIEDVNYVEISQCDFINFSEGINIKRALGVNISGSVFSRGARSIYVNNIGHLEVYHNTILDADAVGSTLPSDVNLRVIYHTLTPNDILNKRISLPTYAMSNTYGYDVGVSVTTGPSFYYDTDYTVIGGGSVVSWAGLVLDGQLEIGEVLRILYSETTTPGSGEAIRAEGVIDPNSRVDSNNFTGLGTPLPDIAVGVYFNTPLKIRYNNFMDVTVPYTGDTPTDATGNISADPLYVDALTDDFRLQTGSPDIDAADPERWEDAWLGIADRSVYNAVPFNRNKDHIGVRRNYSTPDIGAFEYVTGINPGLTSYIAESGFDFIHTGSGDSPYATLDKGFMTDKGIVVGVSPVAGYTGILGSPGLGRYGSKNISFVGTQKIDIGASGLGNTALISASYPSISANKVYVSPDGGDTGFYVIGSVTGTYDGSYTGPFRTIDAALSQSAAENIIVLPGIYPEFTSDTGRNLIGVSKTTDITKSGKIISKFLKEEWALTGTADFDFNTLRVYDGSEVQLVTTLDNPIEMHLKLSITDDFVLELSNGTNGFAIKKNTTLSVAHTVDSVTYSIPAPGLGDEISVDFYLNADSMRYIIKGAGTKYHKDILLNADFSTGFILTIKDVVGGPIEVSSFKIVNDVVGVDYVETVYKHTYGIRDSGI